MLLTLVVFFLVLSLLVFVHEAGHYLAARKAGIRIEEVGFGIPPRMFGVQHGKTIYSINWLPIGGFVKLYGEDQEESSNHQAPSSNDAFFAKSKRVRALVLTAGVAMNFLLAIIVISYVFTQGVEVPTDKVFIEEVAHNSPAASASLKTGDQVLLVAGQKITTTQQFIDVTKSYVGRPMSLEVLEKGKQKTVEITPRVKPPKGEGALGVAISNMEMHKYPWYQAPFLGTGEAFRLSGLMISSLGGLIAKLVTLQPVGSEVTGPVGIAQVTGEAVKFGPMAVLQLIGLLSLNLAVVNILPFPALDGGRLLFVFIEAAIGRKVKPRLENMAHQIGMAILLTLIALVTINDLLRILRH